jgi:hypothetical protein
MAERPSEDTKRSEVPQRPLTHRTLAQGTIGQAGPLGRPTCAVPLPSRMSSCREEYRECLRHLLDELNILGVIAYVGLMRAVTDDSARDHGYLLQYGTFGLGQIRHLLGKEQNLWLPSAHSQSPKSSLVDWETGMANHLR